MGVAAPERTYATDADRPPQKAPAENESASALAGPVRPAARRRRHEASTSFAEAETPDQNDEPRDPDETDAASLDRQGGLGNGHLAAEESESGAAAAEPPKQLVDRAEEAEDQAARSTEPEYARSVKLDRPERGETAHPVAESPEAESEAAGLEQEKSADEDEATAAEAEAPAAEAEAAPGEEDEAEQEGDSAVGELEGEAEEEGEGVEGAGEESAAEGGTAAAAAPGVLESQAASARLSAAAGGLMQTVMTPPVFAPHPDEASPVSEVAHAGAAKRGASEALAADFLARNAYHAQALLGVANTAPSRIFAAAEVAKASIDAAVAQNIAVALGAIAGAQATASQQAAAAKAVIEAQRAVSVVLITTSTLGARLAVETQFATTSAELTSLETSQKTGISASYRTWEPRFKNVGTEIAGEAMDTALARGREWLALRDGESSILDGPIHDNRLEARADAAKDVAKAYEAEFVKAAGEQTGQVMAGEADVLKYVTDSATQARDGLTKHHDAILEALDASSTQATDQTNALADQMLQSIDSSLATTLASLAQQQVAQVARIAEYGATQKTAIDDQAGQAAAALLDGGADAIDGFSQSMREFLDSAVAMEAPDSEDVGPALAEAQAQTDGLAAALVAQMEQGIAASELSVATGGVQAVGAVNQLGQSAAEQARATAAGYVASVTSMRQQALEGFTNLRTGHQETAEQVKASATEGFTAAATELREAFSTLSTKTVENFEKTREQMRAGLRETFPDLKKAIEKSADEAAAAVQPRWKSVVKWIITIVVIVAVVALTIVSAGSLGVVGTILLGAALGAAAGAVTTIGHNLVDGKEWSEGVAKAMVVGAIGGAFGGIGGALAGKVASTALKFAIETGVDAVGGVVGDLLVGNQITLAGVLTGAAIGAAVGGGLKIGGALKGKIKIRSAPKVSAPKVEVSVSAPTGPKSRTRSFLERTTILAKTPDVHLSPPVAAPKPKPAIEAGTPAPKPDAPVAPPHPSKPAADVAPPPKSVHEAPPPKAAADAAPPKATADVDAAAPKATADAPAKTTAGEPKSVAEPSGPKAAPEGPAPGKGAGEPTQAPKAVDDGAVGKGSEPVGKSFEVDEPGVVARRKTPDGHEIKITENGDIVRCTTCALHPYREVLDADPGLAKKLQKVQADLGSEKAATRRKALAEFDALSDEMERRVKAAKVATPDTPTAKAGGEPPVNPKPSASEKAQLSRNGKFKDPDVEDAYLRYVERKKVENVRAAKGGQDVKPVRKRLDWKQASDWWQKNSPIARGNDFNSTVKSQGAYDFDEVVLENGKRVDSYNKPAKTAPGEIVSRKATDLNLIDQKTFKDYLGELKDKYKPGTLINSPKYGKAFKPGAKLQGNQVLEVPDNAANRAAAEYRGFADLAKAQKIELRFRPE